MRALVGGREQKGAWEGSPQAPTTSLLQNLAVSDYMRSLVAPSSEFPNVEMVPHRETPGTVTIVLK